MFVPPIYQCDQMARLFFHYLAIYSNEILPIRIQVVPKWVHNFAQYQMILENIAKVAKIRQIWSYCYLPSYLWINDFAFELLSTSQ